jgi:formate C-acetyltransferase
MCGNDRSATVDCNPNLVKASSSRLATVRILVAYTDALWCKAYPAETGAPKTGDPRTFADFEAFYQRFLTQLNYGSTGWARSTSVDTALRRSCANAVFKLSRARLRRAGEGLPHRAARAFVCDRRGLTFATTVDSLLAIRYLVYDQKLCTVETLIKSVAGNWKGTKSCRRRRRTVREIRAG